MIEGRDVRRGPGKPVSWLMGGKVKSSRRRKQGVRIGKRERWDEV